MRWQTTTPQQSMTQPHATTIHDTTTRHNNPWQTTTPQQSMTDNHTPQQSMTDNHARTIHDRPPHATTIHDRQQRHNNPWHTTTPQQFMTGNHATTIHDIHHATTIHDRQARHNNPWQTTTPQQNNPWQTTTPQQSMTTAAGLRGKYHEQKIERERIMSQMDVTSGMQGDPQYWVKKNNELYVFR